MNRVSDVKPLGGYRLWLRFEDGTQGEVDLADLAGRGVFAAWQEPGVFQAVRIGQVGELCWPREIDLCPDSLYLRLTGKRPEEVFPGLGKGSVHA